jgi:mannobiose 2-epimerase
LGGPAFDRRKVWWVQAEVLVGALTGYRIWGDPRYANLYLATLAWIEERHVDWAGGDWHAYAHRNGTVSGDKAGLWKSPYHNGRAMMECLRLLQPGDPLASEFG